MTIIGQPAAPAGLAARLGALTGEFWRYLGASVLALGVDFGLLWLLTERGHLHYLSSSAISYSTGAVVHYLISVTLVFRERRVTDWRKEFVGFFAIGLLGLAVSQLVMKTAVDGLGQSYLLGKVAATGVSFALTFVTRRAVLFTAGALQR